MEITFRQRNYNLSVQHQKEQIQVQKVNKCSEQYEER